MGLTKHRIGSLITPVDERNSNGIFTDFYGINIDKEFMPSVANTETVNPRNYKILRKGRFLFSGMQTGRDKCIRIGLYSSDEPIIVSPAYTIFEVTSEEILSEYLFMMFKRREMDRLGWFLSDSSVRSNLDWDRFCDIELDIPPVSIQQKYVNVYNALLANQQAYVRGLEDIKLTCDAYIERLRYGLVPIAIGDLISPFDERNKDNAVNDFYGINIDKEFMPTAANTANVNPRKYKIVSKSHFVFSGMQTGRDQCIRIGLYNEDDPIIVSPAYTTFEVVSDKILPEYFFMLFKRKEMDRFGWFLSDSSVRSNLDWDRFCEIKIGIPSIKIQQYIINIYTVYQLRREISEQLKAQIKDLCPMLIKGSLEEATRV